MTLMLLCGCLFLKRSRPWLLLVAINLPLMGADPAQMAQRVYERLTQSAGVANAPKLVVQTWKPGANDRVAFMRAIPGLLPRREIVIDDKTIAICESMGQRAEACIAYFLGHELAHYANNHNWGSHFAHQQVNQNISPARSVEYETQADRFGGFYAALAGYDSLSVAGEALANVYREYGIAPDLPGYQSLADRQKVPEAARDFLSGLLPMFDAAGLLMAVGYYQEAATLYDAILDQFPSREIYNNAGVALANLCDPSIPWLLDASTRLPERAIRRGQIDIAATTAAARDHFEKAIFLDRDYAVAHLNLALLLKTIGQEPERSEAELKTAIRLARGNAAIEAIARGETLVAASNITSAEAELSRAALLPGGKRPADFVPARPEPVVNLSGGISFFSRRMNGLTVVSVRPLGPDGKTLSVVFLPRVPDDWAGRLGHGREIVLFPSKATLFESLGLLITARGAQVYQLR